MGWKIAEENSIFSEDSGERGNMAITTAVLIMPACLPYGAKQANEFLQEKIPETMGGGGRIM